MLLSIIIPVYNVEKYIQKCLDSIVELPISKDEYEIIVVNDGTQDNSMAIVNSFQKTRKNLHVITQTNKGLSAARNAGNIETRIGTNGKPYIMECTPRGGGNRLSEMLRYATGVDMITAQVRAAVGDSVDGIEQKPYNGHWAEVILHADADGIFQSLQVAEQYQANVVDTDLWVEKGDKVSGFNGANDAIGTLKMRFEEEKDMLHFISHVSQYVTINVK